MMSSTRVKLDHVAHYHILSL